MMGPWRLQHIAAFAVPVHEQVLQVHPAWCKTVAPLDGGKHVLPTDLDLLLRLPEDLLRVLVPKIGTVLVAADVGHFNLHIAVAWLSRHFLYCVGAAVAASSGCTRGAVA